MPLKRHLPSLYVSVRVKFDDVQLFEWLLGQLVLELFLRQHIVIFLLLYPIYYHFFALSNLSIGLFFCILLTTNDNHHFFLYHFSVNLHKKLIFGIYFTEGTLCLFSMTKVALPTYFAYDL